MDSQYNHRFKIGGHKSIFLEHFLKTVKSNKNTTLLFMNEKYDNGKNKENDTSFNKIIYQSAQILRFIAVKNLFYNKTTIFLQL